MRKINLKISNCLECPYRHMNQAVEEYECRLNPDNTFLLFGHDNLEEKVHEKCDLEEVDDLPDSNITIEIKVKIGEEIFEFTTNQK